MNIKTDFPRKVRENENTWIPMSDGAKLAARLWLPEDAEQNPVPAILEYIPYRKDDMTARGDALRHPYFAGHGYAALRVDLRGSGDSDGLLLDEYLPQEQDDALEVIQWIADQPWCAGAVGMIGISWGGFSSLQVAARRPPALKAIITLCSTDDRYADDAHYVGGSLLGSDTIRYGSMMVAYNALPPNPRFVGDRWRETWLNRMASVRPFAEAWLSHPRRDAYWKHGSVCEDFARIACPVYAVGGWADGYTNAIPRLLAGLRVPRKGLIGPWAHLYPEVGVPGPAIGFLQECLRWWDYWLRGSDTGIMDEPMIRVWMQESVEPRSHYETRPGRWVTEPGWPPPDIVPHVLYLNADGLAETPGEEAAIGHLGSQWCGVSAGNWCPFGSPGDLPTDQRWDDGLSLTLTSPPLAAPQEVLGFPEITLDLAADKPNAVIVARLCDVSPTGASTLISWGALNLTHRESHENPTPLEPGRRYTVTLRLNAIGHRLAAGHRWRLALSPTYWPHVWPSPEPVTLTVFTGAAARLTLPARPPRPEDETRSVPPFGPPETAPPLPVETLRVRAEPRRREVRRHVQPREGLLEIVDCAEGSTIRHTADGLEYDTDWRDTFSIVEGDPLAAAIRVEHSIEMRRGDWRTRVEVTTVLSSAAAAFRLTNSLDAYEGNVRVFSKTWDFSAPRDLA